jgi:uncharacterized protein (DUF302 family)
MKFGFKKTVHESFEVIEERVRGLLRKNGFGVITEIDIKETIKQKLDKEFPNYKILGACNPPIAYEALVAEPMIGLLLPCNITVIENDDRSVTVAAIDAQKMLSISGLENLSNMALKVNKLLQQTIDDV